ncbi:MAG: PAS domain-containing protein [Planctomycetota bacterium]|nr:MAG: PAS domain-containing protein [Planctomycetota bacterium]
MAPLVTCVVLCSLFIGGLAEWSRRAVITKASSGISEHATSWGWGSIASISYVAAAVGVVLVCWHWSRLISELTSIARQLQDEQVNYIGPSNSDIINHLCEAVNDRFGKETDCKAQLERQIEDLQIQMQIFEKRGRDTEAIIYSIRDAVIVVDEFDNLLMANEAAGRLFNFDPGNSQHRPVCELISHLRPDSGENQLVDLLQQSRQGKIRNTRREITLSRNDELQTFDCVVSCMYEQKKQVSSVVAVLHDITREKEISQMKNDFVSSVCHELKTPLASITAYSEMLCDGEADDEKTRKEFYAVIQGQAQRLNRLIEDSLNISRIESGLTKVDKKPASLTILIEEQLQMIKNYAAEKNIEVIRDKPIVLDPVNVDRDMISQVIVNLLSNAIKYTPAGGSVRIQTDVDEPSGLVRVNITDTGVGIPDDEIERVFDKFYRVAANKGQAKGTGLGLNLVKQIVEKIHNGRVFATSKVGAGSTFGFELPLATAQMAKV